jgi:PAS domain S-box-containing protein
VASREYYLVRGDIFRSRTCQLLTACCLIFWHGACFAEASRITTTSNTSNTQGYFYWFLALLLCLLAGYFMGSRRRIDEESYQEAIEKKLSLSDFRLKKQQAALAVLTTNQLKDWQNPEEIFRDIAKVAAETLDVERVSVWLFSDDSNTQLDCMCLYLKSKNLHTVTQPLLESDLPSYFKQLTLHRVIPIDNVRRHPATVDFNKDYLLDNKIGAMLDGTVRLNGIAIGVICHEHVGGTREWNLDEQNFAGSVADLCRITLETCRRRNAEQAVIKHSEQLEHMVAARTLLLQESERRFSYVVEHAPIPILLISKDGDILDINPEALSSGHYSREDVIGKNFIETIVAKESRKKALATAVQALKGKDFRNVELVLQTSDGRKAEYLCSIGKANRSQQGASEMVAIAQNISEQKALQSNLIKAREAAESADRIKSMFVASMSHELRTPLNSILGFLGVVLQGMSGELNLKQKDQLGRAYNSAKHLLSLISDVIDISKIEAGFLNVHVEKFEFRQLLIEVEYAVQHLAGEKKLDLYIDCPAKVMLVTDRKRLYQVVLNVVSNALKYTEKGTVKVTASVKNKQLSIAVEDTGIGIDEAGLANLFKPFERIDSRLRIKTLGTGLGLYLTRKILSQLLGGTIEAKSKPELGSTFTIIVPTKMPEIIVQNASILEEPNSAESHLKEHGL